MSIEERICPRCGKHKIWFSWEKKCSYCKRQEYDMKIKADILGGETEVSNEDKVYCPWCGEALNYDDAESEVLYEEGEHEMTCPYCDKEFRVSTEIRYQYSTTREVDE